MKTFTRKSSRLSEEIRMGATQDTLLYTIEKSIKKILKSHEIDVPSQETINNQ